MAGNSDKFKVKRPNLSQPREAFAKQNVSETENTKVSETMAAPETAAANKVEKIAPKSVAEIAERETAAPKKQMLQTGYRIREDYIEALRLQGKREERKIESVLDEILSSYFDGSEKGRKYLETAHQILQIKLDY